MDEWRALLVKYMAHVLDVEGVTFMPTTTTPMYSDGVPFTAGELFALEGIEAEAVQPRRGPARPKAVPDGLDVILRDWAGYVESECRIHAFLPREGRAGCNEYARRAILGALKDVLAMPDATLAELRAEFDVERPVIDATEAGPRLP